MQNIAKKIIPYLFILIAIFAIGFFGWGEKASAAESPDDRGDCKITTESASGNTPPRVETKENITRGQCTALKTPTASTVFTLKVAVEDVKGICTTNGTITEDTKKHCEDGGGQWRLKGSDNNPDVAPDTGTKGAFETEVNKFSCGIGIGSDLFPACLIKFLYYTMYVFPSLLLAVVAYFFNVLISITLSSTLLKSDFISEAWGVVRDLSNIFFILILLYIAIKIILDLGGHEAKQMIAKVIIMALLINFSMFFTQVIIDTSNVLALVFYNKLSTGNKDKDGKIVSAPYQAITGEKDISGGLVSAFNPTSALGPEFFTAARKPIQLPGQPPNTKLEEKVPEGMLVGIIIITGAIFLVAIYALFISGLAFLGRLIELFILLIFSPFAFMSFVVPKFAHVEYLGWDDWLKRLISVSFMAPIFMFFLYFIFMLVRAKMYDDMLKSGDGIIIALLRMIIPALFVLILLLKATEYAKKGSGKFGEVLMTGAKLAGGIALGAATGGASLALTNTMGSHYQNVANDDKLRAAAAGGDKKAQKRLSTANKFANKSFDIRDTGIGKFAAKQSGMDFTKGTGIMGLSTDKLKGGRAEQVKHKIEEEEKKNKTYELSGDAAIKQNNRAAKYEEDKKQAKLDAENSGQQFKEDTFKEEYQKGNLVGYGRDDRKVESGDVENTAQINKDRRKAYADSLGDAAKKEAEKNIIKTFGSEFGGEMKKMYTTTGGIAQTAALGAVTGGAGLIAGPLAFSLARAIKATVAKKVMGNVRSTNAEVIAGVRKGPDEYKELIKKMKKDLEGGGHGNKEHKEEHPAPAATPGATPAEHPPAGGAPAHH